MASQSTNQANTAVHGGMGKTPTPANSVGGNSIGAAEGNNRRGSQGGGLFSGLMNQKRNSTDAAANARRQSFAEMKPEPGVLGKMWNNFTTGSGNPPK